MILTTFKIKNKHDFGEVSLIQLIDKEILWSVLIVILQDCYYHEVNKKQTELI